MDDAAGAADGSDAQAGKVLVEVGVPLTVPELLEAAAILARGRLLLTLGTLAHAVVHPEVLQDGCGAVAVLETHAEDLDLPGGHTREVTRFPDEVEKGVAHVLLVVGDLQPAVGVVEILTVRAAQSRHRDQQVVVDRVRITAALAVTQANLMLQIHLRRHGVDQQCRIHEAQMTVLDRGVDHEVLDHMTLSHDRDFATALAEVTEKLDRVGTLHDTLDVDLIVLTALDTIGRRGRHRLRTLEIQQDQAAVVVDDVDEVALVIVAATAERALEMGIRVEHRDEHVVDLVLDDVGALLAHELAIVTGDLEVMAGGALRRDTRHVEAVAGHPFGDLIGFRDHLAVHLRAALGGDVEGVILHVLRLEADRSRTGTVVATARSEPLQADIGAEVLEHGGTGIAATSEQPVPVRSDQAGIPEVLLGELPSLHRARRKAVGRQELTRGAGDLELLHVSADLAVIGGVHEHRPLDLEGIDADDVETGDRRVLADIEVVHVHVRGRAVVGWTGGFVAAAGGEQDGDRECRQGEDR